MLFGNSGKGGFFGANGFPLAVALFVFSVDFTGVVVAFFVGVVV